ncbi:MAG: ParA family protein [Chloroflexi bacterium]|nr:ParA family protein [Chloroflexota bacterium]
MAVVAAIANQKGGVGKTTTAVNVAAYIAAKGNRVLLADLDGQANATSALGLSVGEGPSVHEVLVRSMPPGNVIRPTNVQGLHLLPSSPSLVAAEIELAPQIGREFKLRRSFQDIDGDYDFVLIDCPPALNLLTVNAFSASRYVFVPVQCEYLALEGLSELLSSIQMVKDNLNPQLELGGIIMTMYDSRTALSKEVVNEVRNHFPQTFKAVIPRNVRLAEAPSHGATIMEYAPESPAAKTYAAVAEEVLQRLRSK